MKEIEFRDHYCNLAKNQTLETLIPFIEEVVRQGRDDYGKICRAIAASALAVMHAIAKQEGITGFQAGCVLWDVIREWQYSTNESGLRIVDYDDMLYVQYESKFQKTIRKSVFEAMQKKAQRLLDENVAAYQKYQKDMVQYHKDIAAFIAKHPDYNDRPEYYNHLGCGTADQWQKEEEKKKSGFEFAPDKPCYHRPVQIEHWQSIVAGTVPFGYEIDE
jgi:hypothetical protein